jgi:hypothetical protein
MLSLAVLISREASAQGGLPPPRSPKEAAPVDLTGYWVSLVTEDWRFRMVTPPKGDFTSVPLNADGRKVAQAWDPAKDEASGELCKAYGAAGLLRLPGRLHITWQDDNALRLDTDAGTQTRIFYFGQSGKQGAGDWQGVSTAAWDRPGSPMGFGFLLGPGGRGGQSGGSLKVVTTELRAGYLRKNGVPYSAGAVVTEYFDRLDVPGGDSLLVVSTEVNDPAYLLQPFWTSTHFKKQADASGWNPTACSAR